MITTILFIYAVGYFEWPVVSLWAICLVGYFDIEFINAITKRESKPAINIEVDR